MAGTIDRTVLHGYAGAVVVLNLYATSLFHAVRTYGWAGGTLRLFEVSAVIWLAIAAIVAIAREPGDGEPPARRDCAVIAIALALILVPWHVLALPALFLLGGYGLWRAPAQSRMRRAAVVMLAIAGSNLIGRWALIALGGPIMAADAGFVAFIAGVPVNGNVVKFAGEHRDFIVGLPCSSVHNMSLGAILWATATQVFRLPLTFRQLGYGLAAVAALFAINAARLTMIAWYPVHFDTLHNGLAGEAFGWLSLLAAGAVVVLGVIDGARRAR